MGAAESTIAASYRLLQPDGSPVSGTPAAGDGAHPRLFAAVHKATGTRASVFRFSLPLHSGTSGVAVPAGSGASLGSPAADDMAGVQHGAGGAAAADDIASVLASGMNRLKTMRHPGIIKFVSGEVRGGTAFVVTEPVQRISAALPAMCEEEVCLGIFNLLKTVEFMHSLGVCHNSIHLDSIYLAEDRRWVLGNLEFARNFDQITPRFTTLLHSYLPEDLILPEDTDPSLPKDPQSSRDCFALGRVISTIIAPLVSQQKLAPSSTAFAWGQLNDLTTQLSVRSPSERPTVRMVLDAPFFRNNVLIEIVERFLKQIRVIAPAFKERMFQQLFTKFQCLPSKTVNDFVLPMLLKYELFSEPGADEFFLELLSPSPALPARPISSPFEPQPVISRDAYARHIVPFIRRAFTVRQFETRLFLLRALDRFVDVACDVDETLLESVVIPELVLGLLDADDAIYVQSVCGIAKCLPRYCQLICDKRRHADGDPVATPASDATAPGPSFAGLSTAISGAGALPAARLSGSANKGAQSKRPSSMINSGRSSAGGDVGALSDDQKQPRQPTLARKRSAPLLRTPSSHELEQYKPLFPPLGLVEDTLIPHALRICISDSVEPELLWHLLDSLAVVWKRLSVLIARNKAYDPNELTRMTRSLIKCFHLLIRVLPVDAKIEFFCNRLCGNLEQGGDASAFAVVWIPRLIELAIPFLRDDNREVRRHVSAAVMRMLTIMSTALDRTPTIARKREQTSLVTKLQRAYGANRRVQHLFPKSGPRRSRAPSHGVSPAFESGVNFAAAQASSAPGLSMSPDSVPGANANSWPRQMRERLDSFSGVEVSVPESSLPRSSDAAAQTLSASHKARLQYSVPRSESGDSYTAAHFGAADMSTDSATADVAGIGRDSVVHVHEHETWETSWDDFGDEDHVDEGGAAAVHAPLPSANNGDSLTSSSATSAPVTSLSRDNARKAGAAADVNGDPKQDCATPEAGSAADLSLQRTEPPAAMAQRPPLANGSAHPSRLSAHGVPLSASASAPASLPAPPASLTGETGAYANRSSAVPPTPSAAARSPTRLVVRSASSASAHDGASTTDSPTRSVFSDSTSGHDAQALGPSGTSSSFGPTGKYVKRDVLKQKREAKHAETLRRKTSSSSFKVGVVASPNLADSRVMSPTTATAGGPALLPSAATVTAAAAPTARAEKVAVALVQEPAPASAEIDYFKDMVPAQVRKTGILAAATAATVAMTGSIQRTSETLLSDLGELSGIRAAKPPTAGRVAFQGSSTDLADMALGWGEDLDEDISLDNVRLE